MWVLRDKYNAGGLEKPSTRKISIDGPLPDQDA